MASCECGAFITDRFARVFGNNDDDVVACPSCTTKTAVLNGAAAGQVQAATHDSARTHERGGAP